LRRTESCAYGAWLARRFNQLLTFADHNRLDVRSMNSSVTIDRRSIASWALYDFANSSFTTLVVTFIYATYFTKAIAADPVSGTAQWSLAVTITSLVVALASPYLGAIADRGGYRKRFLLISTIVVIVGSFAMFFPGPGQVLYALTIFVIANIAFELANVFYNAYLPDLAPPDKIGRISGYGWALGYVGGMLCMLIALFALVQVDVPPFGLDASTGEHIRATNILVSVWFAIFCIPMFVFVPELQPRLVGRGDGVMTEATRQIVRTFHDIRRFRQIFRLLVARLIYNDGLVTIFAFGGIYAAGTFGFTIEEVMIFGIALNVSAGLGAYMFGFLDDRIGGKKTILITLVGLTFASLLAVLTHSAALFWASGILVGLLVGPNQSASRSLMGRFVPDDKETEFYGFFAFSGKATAFLGPLLLGQLTGFFGNQRFGVAIVMVFFIVGALLTLRVDEAEGIELAARPADH
jgi:UMF1 family MFS transporter